MSTLEREILDYVVKLDTSKQQQVLDYLRALIEASKSQMTLGEWMEQADAFRVELAARYGSDHFGGIQNMLDDVREERLNDLMGRP